MRVTSTQPYAPSHTAMSDRMKYPQSQNNDVPNGVSTPSGGYDAPMGHSRWSPDSGKSAGLEDKFSSLSLSHKDSRPLAKDHQPRRRKKTNSQRTKDFAALKETHI